ncbi:MAG: MerR family transcriptional regulator, light-induced transcriptional regulator [Actinomycetota bacterium]|jgi:DNA-binding transcriptional MerR regulator|nr:MerR family transcriptional regulator, light-induced transcriptional regulator [Actinomycetota bacterium]
MVESELLRIGELSRRSGVSPDLLRAWERRYGLLKPARSSGGLRLYSVDDLERVRLMLAHLGNGLAAAQAAALAAGADVGAMPTAGVLFDPGAARTELTDALEQYDEPRAQAVLDRLLATVTLDSLISELVLPYLRDLGDRWQRGEASIAQEHFASNVLRGRLLGLARGWGLGGGRLALIACPPKEQHDIGLICFGLLLRSRGWRIGYLGGDTPLESLVAAADALDPSLLLLSAVAEKRFSSIESELKTIAKHHRLVLGGAGARGVDAAALGTLEVTNEPIAAAERITEIVRVEDS